MQEVCVSLWRMGDCLGLQDQPRTAEMIETNSTGGLTWGSLMLA